MFPFFLSPGTIINMCCCWLTALSQSVYTNKQIGTAASDLYVQVPTTGESGIQEQLARQQDPAAQGSMLYVCVHVWPPSCWARAVSRMRLWDLSVFLRVFLCVCVVGELLSSHTPAQVVSREHKYAYAGFGRVQEKRVGVGKACHIILGRIILVWHDLLLISSCWLLLTAGLKCTDEKAVTCEIRKALFIRWHCPIHLGVSFSKALKMLSIPGILWKKKSPDIIRLMTWFPLLNWYKWTQNNFKLLGKLNNAVFNLMSNLKWDGGTA